MYYFDFVKICINFNKNQMIIYLRNHVTFRFNVTLSEICLFKIQRTLFANLAKN